MICIRQEVTVQAINVTTFEKQLAAWQEFLQQQSGLQARRVMTSLSYPGRYATLTYWDSRQAVEAYVRSDAFAAFAEQNPIMNLVTLTRPVEAFDLVHDVGVSGQDGDVTNVTLIEWEVPLGNWDAFEESRKELFELRQQAAAGIVRQRLLRSSGYNGKYLITVAATSEDAGRIIAQAPAVAAFMQAHPASAYTDSSPRGERYQPVRIAVSVMA